MLHEQQVFFDMVELVCACGRTRKSYPLPMLRGAEHLIAYLQDPQHMSRCECGAEKCDVKARIRMTCAQCTRLMPLQGPCTTCGWVAPPT